MPECKAVMQSYTQAAHARRVLQRSGLDSEIRRTPSPGSDGCGYLLAIQGDCRIVSNVFAKENIPFRRYQGCASP
ncbi:MAG: DUF3343 domain-containing protein [Ruminococcus sp.]|nr:DUF3343 domain-containing protein [Ruminococcus sp.]